MLKNIEGQIEQLNKEVAILIWTMSRTFKLLSPRKDFLVV